MLDFVSFCIDLIFSVGTVRFSCMKNREKDAKNRAWSNTRIGRRAGESVPGVDDRGSQAGWLARLTTTIIISSHWKGRYNWVFYYIAVAKEAGDASPRRRQGGRFESNNGR